LVSCDAAIADDFTGVSDFLFETIDEISIDDVAMSLVECPSMDCNSMAIGCCSYEHSKLFFFVLVVESGSDFDRKWHRYALANIFDDL